MNTFFDDNPKLFTKLQINKAIFLEKVFTNIPENAENEEFIDHSAQVSASMGTIHPDYLLLAGRIITAHLHSKTTKHFSYAMSLLNLQNPIQQFIIQNSIALDLSI